MNKIFYKNKILRWNYIYGGITNWHEKKIFWTKIIFSKESKRLNMFNNSLSLILINKFCKVISSWTSLSLHLCLFLLNHIPNITNQLQTTYHKSPTHWPTKPLSLTTNPPASHSPLNEYQSTCQRNTHEPY